MTPTIDTQDVLARVMTDRGYANPQDLAAASGVPYNTLYRWVTGKANPHRRNLVALLDAIGADPETYGVPRPEPKAAPLAIGAIDELKAWIIERDNAAEERAKQRHTELLTALQPIHDRLGTGITIIG